MSVVSPTQPTGASPGLEVRQLRVVYEGFVAVADTSFHVKPGESFGIVAESGSGKSTVLRAICGLAPKESGAIALLAQDAAPGTSPATQAVPGRYPRGVILLFIPCGIAIQPPFSNLIN